MRDSLPGVERYVSRARLGPGVPAVEFPPTQRFVDRLTEKDWAATAATSDLRISGLAIRPNSHLTPPPAGDLRHPSFGVERDPAGRSPVHCLRRVDGALQSPRSWDHSIVYDDR